MICNQLFGLTKQLVHFKNLCPLFTFSLFQRRSERKAKHDTKLDTNNSTQLIPIGCS
jgi:hypothetical protein